MAVKIKLDVESLKLINLFQSITKAGVKDCIVDLDKVLFVVKPGQAGLAIGRDGSNIKNIQRLIKKRVEVVEFSPELVGFINNLLRPVRVKGLSEVSNGGKRVVRVEVDAVSGINPKVYARGKLRKSRDLLRKYFGVSDVTVL